MINNRIIGNLFLLVQRFEQIFSSCQFFRRPAACALQSPAAQRSIRVDEHDHITDLVQPGLIQFRRVEYDGAHRRVGPVQPQQLGTPAGEAGIEQRFQPGKLLAIVKHDRSDGPPVHAGPGRTDAWAPPTLENRHNLGLTKLFMRQTIRIDHRRTKRLEDQGDCRFPGTDAACQTNGRLVW